MKHHLRGFFDLLVSDEVHEYKGRGSAQGIAAGILADACGKSLSLSGTLMGGYSSTLFHLLYRFSPEIRGEFGRGEESRWIERYGFVEHTIGRDDGESLEDGRTSRRRKYRKVIRERPGLAPAALFHLIGASIFLRLADVASGLPPYEERVLLSSMDTEEDATGFSQRSAYDSVFETLRAALTEALAKGSKRLLATYLQTLLAYPDGCTRGETVFDPESEEVLIQVPPLSEEKLYPKEQALVDLVAAERLQGRTGAGLRHPYGHPRHHGAHGRLPHSPRLHGRGDEGRRGRSRTPRGLGRRSGSRRASTWSSATRGWCRRVSTSWSSRPSAGTRRTTPSTPCGRRHVGPGASARPSPSRSSSWPTGTPSRPTPSQLVAKKLQSSLAVEGELPEDGLAAYGDDGDDLMLALARKIVAGDEDADSGRVGVRPGPAGRGRGRGPAGRRRVGRAGAGGDGGRRGRASSVDDRSR